MKYKITWRYFDEVSSEWTTAFYAGTDIRAELSDIIRKATWLEWKVGDNGFVSDVMLSLKVGMRELTKEPYKRRYMDYATRDVKDVANAFKVWTGEWYWYGKVDPTEAAIKYRLHFWIDEVE